MDEKRLRGEQEHTITQAEIDAWRRGQGDAAKNKLLKASETVSVKQAVKLIKLYAELGDIHYLVTKLDVTIDEAKRVLAAFGINSIEDAKAACRNGGVIAEYEDAQTEVAQQRQADDREEHAAAQERLDERQRESETTVRDPEEIDQELHELRQEAQQKNKDDQLRAILAEGLSAKENTSTFRIPLKLIPEFKQLIPHGVSQLQRRFGGSKKDIIGEIKRLVPTTNIEMLRP